MQKLHAARLKVSFGDEVIAEQEREIEILTQEITRVRRFATQQHDSSGTRSTGTPPHSLIAALLP